MLWPDRWPPTFGSGPACCSASPRVPPGGMTTASLNCASAMKFRPFSGSWTTSRFSMTSLISAVVVCSSGARASRRSPARSSPGRRARTRGSGSGQSRGRCRAGSAGRSLTASPRCPSARCAARAGRSGPRMSVTRSTIVPLAGCVAVTVAPGRIPPELSRTTPLISAVLIWATAAVAGATMTNRARRRRSGVMAPRGYLRGADPLVRRL